MQTLSGLMPKGGSVPAASMSGGSNGKMFQELQNADVTTIIDSLSNILKGIVPPQAQSAVVKAIEGMRNQIESVFQTTLNEGYTNMFIAAAVIAVLLPLNKM